MKEISDHWDRTGREKLLHMSLVDLSFLVLYWRCQWYHGSLPGLLDPYAWLHLTRAFLGYDNGHPSDLSSSDTVSTLVRMSPSSQAQPPPLLSAPGRSWHPSMARCRG